ncbi:MAG: hypothetical protein GXY01_07475 [Clostridiales bacterium]|nr:hypothetical protein [Clostridiales bacterium]
MKKLISFVLIFCIMSLACPLFSNAASVSDFSDVMPNDWFYSAVNFVAQKGMFNGTSASTFSPSGTMTRGMFVTVLGRYSGAPAVSEGCMLGVVKKSDVNLRSAPSAANTSVLACLQINSQLEVLKTVPDLNNPAYTWHHVKYKGIIGYIRSDLVSVVDSGFSDVPASSYYGSYVQWAFSNGIASATGTGTFSPERNITREEICSMLYNFAGYKNVQLKPSVPSVSFSDNASISSNYVTAVSMMQQTGVVTGYGDGSFKPKGSATRAEVSAMLMRFIDAIGYKPVIESSLDASGNYIFGTEVPQKVSAGADYFSDACFIGHSLVNGMNSYFGLSNADFFAVNGASAKYMLTYDGFKLSTTHTDESGNIVPDTGKLETALSQKNYGKVYIMLGVNEIGSQPHHRQAFSSNMSALIDLVRKTQPNAKLYLISLTPVSQDCSESRKDVNRDNSIAFNSVIKQLCKDKKAYYLNVFDLLCDNDGFLPKSACMSDGIHLLSPEYTKIKNYLFTHTI